MWLSVSDFKGFALRTRPTWLALHAPFSPSFWLLCKVRYAVPEFWPAHESSCYSDGVDYAEREARVYANVPEAREDLRMQYNFPFPVRPN